MTRDSAAVAVLDDRRRRCHISAALNVEHDDTSTATMTNGITIGSLCSNGDIGPGDGDSSPKSSSILSTTSSSMSSDDDDCPVKTVKAYSCHDSLSSIHKQKADDHNSFVKDPSCSKHDDSTSIKGRLTFYKDGKFIFQLAAHQQQSYKNHSAIMSPCRWIPVPTVVQEQKLNIKNIKKCSQYPQNKTIWPYLVTNTSSDGKSLQTIQQSPQPPLVKSGVEWNQQQQQKSMTALPHTIDIATPTTSWSVVMATTKNIVRRPPRKCSTTTNLIDHSTTDLQHPTYKHPQSQSQSLYRRSQQYQHQSFMMYANDTVKAQRRVFSLLKKRYRPCSNKITAICKKPSSLQKQQQPLINLECVVRNLWCRRHTAELLHRQLSLNNSLINVTATADSVNSRHPSSHLTTTKRRSTAANTGVSVTTMTMNNSPCKKYKSEQPQQDLIVRPKPAAVALVSSNDHSITAILSSNGPTTGGPTNRVSKTPDSCLITSGMTDSTMAASNCFTLQKNFPPSLLRTLLKNPSGERGSCSSSSTLTNNSNIVYSDSGYLQPNIGDSRKQSVTIESVDNNNCLPNIVSADTGLIKDSVHRLPPILHRPAASAAGHLAASYFNALYNQAAIAAAIAYQSHAQLLPSSRVSAGDAWQLQLNRRHVLPSPPEVVERSGVTSATVLLPYSSPLVSATVAGDGILPPNTSSPPLLPLQPLLIHPRQNLLIHNHQQQYQRSEFGGSGIDGIKDMRNNVVGLYKDCSSTDCVPLNLSKDSVTETVDSLPSNTASVR